MTICEVRLQFQNAEQPIALRDKDLIKKIPVIAAAIEVENVNWETTDTIIADPIDIPFSREAGEFLLDNIRKYEMPDKETTVNDYPEADQLSLQELKPIMELAVFFNCTVFRHAIGFVVVKKLEKESFENITRYLGTPMVGPGRYLDEAGGWVNVLEP
ncbi:hypothetical protein GCK72_008303 [Caenorhabditis remanei]|uniref:Uncharacterized protein n=1 Tax=Caenorhabditis remanei TaxID=31234 RepID=A0A6A5GY90_CAERE|nr:hypothetical protein GCK72_008303 [Caenorhabditis remanei]KAF1760057.1 hypothetical protein GCK72_008303 [Caenorhabditis remanei]